MESTGAEMMFAHAASFAATIAFAILWASLRLPHVTSTIRAFVSRAIVLSL